MPTKTLRSNRALCVLTLLFAVATGAPALTTPLADTPLSSASAVQVAPNFLFVLDDSESMNWDYLPDWAGLTTQLYQSRNPSFNGLAYKPDVSYTPPKYFKANGNADSTTYPSQTAITTNGWTAVKNDGYGIQFKSTKPPFASTASDLIGVPGDPAKKPKSYYYQTVAGEYCTDKSLKSCVAALKPTTIDNVTYAEPAALRWCKTAADAVAATPGVDACQATQIDPVLVAGVLANTPFNFARMPSPRTSPLTIGGSGNTSVSNITVGNMEILSAPTSTTSSPSALAGAIAAAINACTFGSSGNCQVAGYSAVATDATLIISAPDASSATPVIVTTSGSGMSVSAKAFARPPENLAPGENLLTVIATGIAPTSQRSDCAGTTCTYAEEMTNYANWWAYYRTRMQAMKSAASRSFDPIGSAYRVGYLSINNNTGSDFQNIATFETSQKKDWYDKLFAAKPGENTPLRVALSNAGRLYAGQLNGSKLNNVAVIDPLQYYCQPNVTLLSTDGYWNEGAGFKLDGTTPVGDQDGPGLETPPQLDGGGPKQQRKTSQWKTTRTLAPTTKIVEEVYYNRERKAILQQQSYIRQSSTAAVEFQDAIKESSTSPLEIRTFSRFQTNTFRAQSQTATLQQRSGPIQTRTRGLETRTRTKMQKTAQLQQLSGQQQRITYQLQQQLTQVQQSTSSDYGSSWDAWSDVASCTPVLSGENRIQCRTQSVSGWNDVSTCDQISGAMTVANPGKDNETRTYATGSECRYQESAPVNLASGATCTPIEKSTASPYTVATAVACPSDFTAGSWSNVTKCTASGSVQCQYTDWSKPVENSLCSDAPPNLPPNYTVGTAISCTPAWTDWVDSAAACTPIDGATECRYKADIPANWSAWANVTTSCEPRAASTDYREQIDCRTNFTDWASVSAGSSCQSQSTGPTQTECQYTSWSLAADDSSCPGTAIAQSKGPDFTTVVAKKCIPSAWTGWIDSPQPCVVDGTTCQADWTEWTAAASTCNAIPGVTECRYGTPSPYVADANCSSSAASTGPEYTVLTAKECRQTTFPSEWSATTSECVPSTTRNCRYATWTPWAEDATCAEVKESAGSTLAAGGAKKCQTGWTGWAAVDACSASADVECQYVWPPSYKNVEKCSVAPTTNTDAPPSATNSAQCLSDLINLPPLPVCKEGPFYYYSIFLLMRHCIAQDVATPPEIAYVADCPDDASTQCTLITTGPDDVSVCTPAKPSVDNHFVRTTCTVVSSGPTSDTLADVAEYYWKTDLREPGGACTGGPIAGKASGDVCANDGAPNGRQYMTTYTLGLGASGLMQYLDKYADATSGDYFSVKSEVNADPAKGICSWQQFGVCNWPTPESNKQSNIDDLWHAAVNGRGTYFSANKLDTMVASISSAVKAIDIKAGALAAVTVVNANLVAGENDLFAVSLTAGTWSGDLRKLAIDGTTGTISATAKWSAQAKLDARAWTERRIHTYDAAATNKLKDLVWDKLSGTEQGYFTTPAIDALAQLCTTGDICLSAADKALASGKPLLDFIRGDASNEGPASSLTSYYRQRAHRLGDIVGSETVYVKGSPWSYADYGYAAFKASNASRTAMVFVAANDGMVHAFTSADGDESWAYVPTIVMPELYRLADKNYGLPGGHRFLVDGTPVMGDICASDCAGTGTGTGNSPPPAVWKTVLVGGLNRGGRGYYALDITEPASPKALWEFRDDNLGYSYGNPVITKLKGGRWVVIVASGYNNVNPGDGQGRLFIIDANSGELIRSISTGVGDTATPSGLARITAWANFPNSDNTAQRVYGGDLLGNVWRFDVNGDIPAVTAPPIYDAQRLAALEDADGKPQAITAKPDIARVHNVPVVYVATGQLLSAEDLASTQQQSLYAIKDRLSDSDYGNPRLAANSFVEQTLTAGTCGDDAAKTGLCTVGQAIVTATNTAVDLTTDNGWYLDFPVAGERVNTDLRLTLGTLSVNTNIPQFGTCSPLAKSVAYSFDYRTGGSIEGTDGLVGVKLSDYLSSASIVVRLVNGEFRRLTQTDEPKIESAPPPTPPPSPTRRVSWRELVNE